MKPKPRERSQAYSGGVSDDASTELPDDGLSGERESPLTEQQSAALHEAAGWVGGEISAVGLGRTDDGDPCVVVYAGPEAPELPSELNGLPVQVISSGPIQAQGEPE